MASTDFSSDSEAWGTFPARERMEKLHLQKLGNLFFIYLVLINTEDVLWNTSS